MLAAPTVVFIYEVVVFKVKLHLICRSWKRYNQVIGFFPAWPVISLKMIFDYMILLKFKEVKKTQILSCKICKHVRFLFWMVCNMCQQINPATKTLKAHYATMRWSFCMIHCVPLEICGLWKLFSTNGTLVGLLFKVTSSVYIQAYFLFKSRVTKCIWKLSPVQMNNFVTS